MYARVFVCLDAIQLLRLARRRVGLIIDARLREQTKNN